MSSRNHIEDLCVSAAAEYLEKKHADIDRNKLDIKKQSLPLARIRRLMKVEENIKNIALEVPFLYAAITEVFIEELTIRAWKITKENRRCIIQYEDLYGAVKSDEMYDFLLYIIRHK